MASAIVKEEHDHSDNTLQAELNPRTIKYEFMGPAGAFLITLAIPAVTYLLYFGCSERAGGCPPAHLFPSYPSLHDAVSSGNTADAVELVKTSAGIIGESLKVAVTDPEWWKGLWDPKAALMYAAWYAFCVVSWAVLPGDEVEGTVLRTGGRQKYKINAFSTFLFTLGLTSGCIYRFGPESFTFFYDHWVGFVTASMINSVSQAVLVYAFSFRKGAILALGGNSGNPIYDFFIGRELNPSIGPFDIKSFNELRPGLILWVLINISMACEQAVRRGGLKDVTDSMWLVVAFQGWYVADALYNEPAILTTMDITTDGFGYMLSIGDLCWLPFTYSLQARYLAFNQIELGPIWTAAIFLANTTGYWIFRGSNGEKNDFRNGSNHKNLKFMNTERGTKLLVSGWWGLCRHPNYLGDLIMGLSWSLPTGFETPITYFYIIYFTILLLHRQARDDEACEKKYGADWAKYKKLVPYKIIPYIY